MIAGAEAGAQDNFQISPSTSASKSTSRICCHSAVLASLSSFTPSLCAASKCAARSATETSIPSSRMMASIAPATSIPAFSTMACGRMAAALGSCGLAKIPAMRATAALRSLQGNKRLILVSGFGSVFSVTSSKMANVP